MVVAYTADSKKLCTSIGLCNASSTSVKTIMPFITKFLLQKVNFLPISGNYIILFFLTSFFFVLCLFCCCLFILLLFVFIFSFILLYTTPGTGLHIRCESVNVTRSQALILLHIDLLGFTLLHKPHSYAVT